VAVAAIAASLEIEVFAGLVAVEIELKMNWMSWLSRH
jgi:hypothetical protein